MKKSLYLSIIWLVTLACIVFGSYFHFRRAKKAIINTLNDLDTTFSFSDEGDGNYDYAQKLQPFNEISIDAKVMEVMIKTGSDFNIEASYSNEKLKPEYTINNGRLIINQIGIKTSGHNNQCDIQITIPEDFSLNDLEIMTNVGEVTIKNIKADSCRVKTNVGEVEIKNVDCPRISADTNVGEVKVDLKNNISDYNINASVDIGEVIVEGRNRKRNFRQTSDSSNKLTIKTNIGDIKIN